MRNTANTDRFDKEVAAQFRAALLARLPGLRLGALHFEVCHDFWMPFRYQGRGCFPVNYTSEIASLEGMTVYSAAQKRRKLSALFDAGTLSAMGVTTFHEMGHAIALALNGQAARIRRENYGFETQGFFDAPKRIRRLGFQNEIEAFAVQCALYDLCEIEHELASLSAVLRLIKRPEWKGLWNKEDKKRIFLSMRRRCSLRNINAALDSLNEELSHGNATHPASAR